MILSTLLLVACVNQGADHRIAADIVCPLQRATSFHSSTKPRWLFKFGHDAPSGLAFPPYLVVQHKGKTKWLLIRLGWRYDVNWMGYIFPTAAVKRVDGPLVNGY